MLFIFGRRLARIGRYIDNDHICYPCKAFDREIIVYRSFFHFCLIPVFPMGGKIIEMHCRNCGDETKLESVLRQYEGKTKTPLYFYSAIVLFAGLTIFWFYWNNNNKKHKIQYVEKPSIGDVYTIRKGESSDPAYYFLRIIAIGSDSVKVLHNTIDYGGFVSSLTRDDYFVKEDPLSFSKRELKRMLENDEIYSIDRDYGDGGNFNDIR